MKRQKGKFFMAVCFAAALAGFCGNPAKAAETKDQVFRKPALSGFTKTWVYAGDEWDATDSMHRIFADDLEDGDLTGSVTSSGTVDTSKPGDYTVTYSVTDQDGNTSHMDTSVTVFSQNDTSEKLVQRTLYTLGGASHLTDIGFNRGYYHDRQSLGLWLPAGGRLTIRLVNAEAFGEKLEIGFYNDDQETESKAEIPADGSFVELSNAHESDSVPFIVTPKNIAVQPVVEFKWTEQTKEIPYYRYKDDEQKFFARWEELQSPFAIIEGSAATFLAPAGDKDNIINSTHTSTPEYRFQSLDEMLEWYMAFVKQYDEFAGLDFYAEQPYDQNIRAKFFIKANKNGVGAAYYTTDHSASNSDSLGGYLTRSWLALHEFAHGYEGAIATQENSFVETTNNIMGHYFEKTYRPQTEFGWLLGDSNEPTAEERLATLEQKSLQRKNETDSFNGIVAGGWHYQVSLHMFTNALDRLGPKETVSNMHRSYRKYYYENKKMRGSSDAVVESFSESGYNMVPYFETYHITPSQKVENEIYEKDYPILYYIYDLIPDQTLATKARKELGLPGVYCLADADDLAFTGYTSQVEFQIEIDDLTQIRGKNIVIKNGKKIVKRIPVTGTSLTAEIPIGAYEVEVPAPNTAAYAYDPICLVASKGTVTKKIAYERETGNALADDMRLTLHGMSDCLFAYITLDTSAGKLDCHLVAQQPHYGYGEEQYAAIRVYGPSGGEIYSRTIAGNEDLADTTTELDFPIGAKLVIDHAEGNSRLRVMGTYFGDRAAGYATVNGENSFVMTKYGLMQEGWDEERQEQVYAACLHQYSGNTAGCINSAQLQNPEKYHQAKMVIQNAYQKLSEAAKEEYDKKWGIFTGRDTILTYTKIPSDSLSGKADSEAGISNDGLGPAALDGDESTYWHSNYSGKNEANFEEDKNNNYTITLDKNADIGKLVYVPRPGGGNGTILACDLYYSQTDKGDDFEKISHPKVSWMNNGDAKTLEFEAKNAKRLRIHVTSGANGNYISAAEFYLYEMKELQMDAADIYLGNLADGEPENGAGLPQKENNGKELAFSAGMSVVYDVEGKNFDVFTALAGLKNMASEKAAQLFIYGDGELLYESGALAGGLTAMPYLDIGGVKKLKIAVTGDEGAQILLSKAKFYLTENKESLALIVGETARLASNASLNLSELGQTKWSSENEAVAAVDGAGNVTAVGAGETVISAVTEGMEAPKTYKIYVREKTVKDPDIPDKEDEQPLVLKKPENIKISADTASSLTVSWQAVSGADGYEVYRAKKGSNAFVKAADVSGRTSYTDTRLASGTDYVYKVRAYSRKGNSTGAFSEEAWSTTKPSKTTIKKVKKSGTKALIQWKKNKQAKGYEIWMKQKGAFKKMKNAAAGKTSIKSKKLQKGKKYSFKIRAYRLDGRNQKIYGAFSKTVKIKM